MAKMMLIQHRAHEKAASLLASAHLPPGAHHPAGAGVGVAGPGVVGPYGLIAAAQLRARHQALLLPSAAGL